MRKYFCIILCIVLCVASMAIPALAETEERYAVKNASAGDADGDSSVNTKDVLLMRKLLAKWEVTPVYENSDLNGDCLINTKDLLMLRKMLAGYKIETKAAFSADDKDITDTIEYLGNPYEVFWPIQRVLSALWRAILPI